MSNFGVDGLVGDASGNTGKHMEDTGARRGYVDIKRMRKLPNFRVEAERE